MKTTENIGPNFKLTSQFLFTGTSEHPYTKVVY